MSSKSISMGRQDDLVNVALSHIGSEAFDEEYSKELARLYARTIWRVAEERDADSLEARKEDADAILRRQAIQ